MAYCESAELDDPEIRFPEQQLPLLHGIAVVRFHDLNDGRGSSSPRFIGWFQSEADDWFKLNQRHQILAAADPNQLWVDAQILTLISLYSDSFFPLICPAIPPAAAPIAAPVHLLPPVSAVKPTPAAAPMAAPLTVPCSSLVMLVHPTGTRNAIAIKGILSAFMSSTP